MRVRSRERRSLRVGDAGTPTKQTLRLIREVDRTHHHPARAARAGSTRGGKISVAPRRACAGAARAAARAGAAARLLARVLSLVVRQRAAACARGQVSVCALLQAPLERRPVLREPVPAARLRVPEGG